MTDTSKSEASRRSIEGLNLSTDSSGLDQYVESLKNLSLALLVPSIAQHEDPGVRLTFSGVPTDQEIEQGDMSVFLQLLLQLGSGVCALDMSLRRNVEDWFRRPDQDKGPRRFAHIEKLYIRFPKKLEDQSRINEPEDQSPDEPKDQAPNEPKNQSPEVSLEQVTQLLKDSLAPDNRFPNLEELHISGLDEDSILKAEADASIGRDLFMFLIYSPYTSPHPDWCPKSKQGPPGQPSPYHVVTRRDSENEDELVIKWEEKPKELPMLPQVPESNTGSPP
ncbi:hypothetical protein EXIGLDRAFT_834763 [Exidia glandulosa HHB12029]|uniref:Uncharacterized protein n=1 Tax=Exidia glandulosa HHB12029 TaxID=1314781 RepID=A0A165JG75_EXIGL|nr:hypothetical protein EXIGLDRAFT_834763 [Exidia glandulosa HHB12029]